MQNKPKVFNLNAQYGVIQLQGQSIIPFLQGLLTCDLQPLSNDDTDHCWGAFCNTKGRVRALFRVFKKKQDFFLLTVKELIPSLILTLRKYAAFSKITVTDVSDAMSILGIACLSDTTDMASVISSLYPSASNTSDFSILKLKEEARSEVLQYSRCILIGPLLSNESAAHLENNLETWKALDIRAGFPEIFLETTEKFLAHHLNLPSLGVVSFTKGCYLGQEIVARMEYQGNIKQELKFETKDLSQIPEEKLYPGSELKDGLNNEIIVSFSKVEEDNQTKVLMLVISYK